MPGLQEGAGLNPGSIGRGRLERPRPKPWTAAAGRRWGKGWAQKEAARSVSKGLLPPRQDGAEGWGLPSRKAGLQGEGTAA